MGRIGDWDIFQTVFHEMIIIFLLIFIHNNQFLTSSGRI